MKVAFITFAFILGIFAIPESPDMHDLHASMARLKYNNSSKSFEISLRIFTDDFEQALSQKNNLAKLSLDNSQKHNDLVKAYIQENFFVYVPKQRRLAMKFISKELESDITLIKFKMPFEKGKSTYKLYNSILTELFDDQVNYVDITYNGKEKNYYFKNQNKVLQVFP